MEAASQRRSDLVVLPRLNAIVDVGAAERAGWDPAELARAFLAGGARFLQLRAKSMPSGALLSLARDLTSRARDVGATLIVNDRADIARLAGADGVHLGQDDLPVAAARAILGPAAVIGKSTHTSDQLAVAAAEPIDYLAIGPVFGSSTKDTGYEPVGLEMVRRAASFGRPLVAIGGITIGNAMSVVEAGAASVAVIGDLLATRDPEARVRAYVKALAGASV
ncbi:MAG TPA: thiamine phosphate synthase [Vicinamibacterales bacterium]